MIPLASILPGVWPWKPITAARHRGESTWFAISRDFATYALEVLPPVYFAGGFACSEPADHAENGAPILCCIVKTGGTHYARECTIPEAEADARMLRHALGSPAERVKG